MFKRQRKKRGRPAQRQKNWAGDPSKKDGDPSGKESITMTENPAEKVMFIFKQPGKTYIIRPSVQKYGDRGEPILVKGKSFVARQAIMEIDDPEIIEYFRRPELSLDAQEMKPAEAEKIKTAKVQATKSITKPTKERINKGRPAKEEKLDALDI